METSRMRDIILPFEIKSHYSQISLINTNNFNYVPFIFISLPVGSNNT